jgi:hypothetical protein
VQKGETCEWPEVPSERLFLRSSWADGGRPGGLPQVQNALALRRLAKRLAN